MLKQKGTTFACFSPPVMAATFAIEIILALYVLVRYKLNAKTRTILAILVCLGAFQLAEYFVCTNSSVALVASRLGFVAISLLPLLGLYLMSLLTKPLARRSLVIVLLLTAIFASYFILAPKAFTGHQCTGNYVIFQIGHWHGLAYGTFYFGTIAASLFRGVIYLQRSPKARAAMGVRWLLVGYAVFMTPVAVLAALRPATKQAIPSVLCGFAVILALIIGLKVTSYTAKKR